MILQNLDFTLDKYRKLCQRAILSDYQILGIAAYLRNQKQGQPQLVMRHDVDRFPGKALRMAYVEKSLNICSTYYFRKSGFSHAEIIKTIAAMGHEIGFHYEVLDEARGDYELSLRLFREELNSLRKFASVETICMHGNPLTKWLNRDLWKYYDFHDLGLIGEAYLSLKDIYYLSDTGRIWDMSRKVKDSLPYSIPLPVTSEEKVITTDDVISLVESRRLPNVCVTVHPERWSYSLATWVTDQIRDTGMNVAKQLWRAGKNKKWR
jgi:hypothetical protein